MFFHAQPGIHQGKNSTRKKQGDTSVQDQEQDNGDGLGRIVDRFAVGDLKNNRYEYHENLLKHPIYPETGYYDDLVEDISRQYLVMTDTENKKMNHLLTPDYLRCVLKKKDDIFKIEYYNRSIDSYLVMHVVPVEWGSEHELEKVMLIAQDIGQKHELENLANTDGLTGLFNERYFNSILHKKELQKLPFILFFLDLDHFKPVNDTYGHDMGDKLLKEAAKRLPSISKGAQSRFCICSLILQQRLSSNSVHTTRLNSSPPMRKA